MIYLEYAATNSFTKYPSSRYGPFLNPNANYAYREQKMLDGCKNRVKAAIGAKGGKVVFGGTSSQLIENLMNWEIGGKRRFAECVIGSKYEHDSFDRFLVDRVGDVDQLEAALVKNRGYRDCVIWQGVNNITGQIFPIEQIGNMCHGYNAFFICDMTAIIGKAAIPDNIDRWCDMAVWSGHKLGTEGGIGCMWLSDGFNEWLGGFKLHGTPNLAGACAIADATEDACENAAAHENYCYELYRYLLAELSANGICSGVVNAALKPDKSNADAPANSTYAINAIMLDNINADSLQQYLAAQSIYVGIGGSACSSLHDFRVLNACGLTNDEASRVIRVSFDYDTDRQDIDDLVYNIKQYKEKFVG